MTNLPLTIDLETSRVVYLGDLNVGLREIELTKGIAYSLPVSFISGGLSVSPLVSGFSCSISQTDKKDTPFLVSSGLTDSSFSLYIASPVLDYAINGNDYLFVETDISFQIGGKPFNLSSLRTRLNNNPSLSAPLEYYPLNDNPSFYATESGVNAGLDLKTDLILFAAHSGNTSNPHFVTKSQVGLSNVVNTDTTNASNISAGTLASARGGAGTTNGILKANGAGLVSAAVSGTDYVLPSDSRLTNARTPSGIASGDLSSSYPNPSVLKVTPNQYPLAGCDVLDLTGDINFSSSSNRHQILNTNGADRILTLPVISSGIAVSGQVLPGWTLKIENAGYDGNALLLRNSIGIDQSRIENGDTLTVTSAGATDSWRANLDPNNQPFVKTKAGIDLTTLGATIVDLFTVPSGLNYIPTSASAVLTNYTSGSGVPLVSLVESSATGALTTKVSLSSVVLNSVTNIPISGTFPIVGGGNKVKLKVDTQNSGTSFTVNVHCIGYYVV